MKMNSAESAPSRRVLRLRGAPNPRQEEFLRAGQKYVAYGGARGGGKSWALRRKCVILAMTCPGIRILLVRRTLPELRENHLLPLMGELGKYVRYISGERAFVFPGGSRLRLGYCADESDTAQYQGQEYDVVCMDEGTQFTEYQFTCLNACLRGGLSGMPKRFYITCNPGGVGHAWVKRLFIDRDYRAGERAEEYAFIPARVRDNEFLMKNDPGYLRQLESLPDELRRAWLDGEWDAFAGQFFSEFNRRTHVCRPFEIPRGWKRIFSADYGLDMLAGLWVALSEEGTAYVYREIYRSDLIVSEAARAILALEAPGEEIALRLAPPDLWGRTRDSGAAVTELFARGGVCFCRANNDRIQGWMALREWLRAPDGAPKLKIFETCANLIRTLPMLRFDSRCVNDAATQPHEPTHAPDALRYFASSQPPPRGREPGGEAFGGGRPGYPPRGAGLSGEITREYMLGAWR
jgi:phage terminase large subunit